MIHVTSQSTTPRVCHYPPSVCTHRPCVILSKKRLCLCPSYLPSSLSHVTHPRMVILSSFWTMAFCLVWWIVTDVNTPDYINLSGRCGFLLSDKVGYLGWGNDGRIAATSDDGKWCERSWQSRGDTEKLKSAIESASKISPTLLSNVLDISSPCCYKTHPSSQIIITPCFTFW